MKRTQIGSHKTVVYRDNDMTCVKYHWTDVVEFNNKKISLDSGGYRTSTTKRRMNQTSDQFNLGFYVFQKNFEWFVNYKDKTIDFEDRMVLER